MKGTLHKTNRGWIVKQVIKEGPQAKLVNQYPLVDNGHIDGLALYKSNEGLEVDFEIIEQFMPYDNFKPIHKFAKILTPEEDELKDWDKQKLVKKWESSGLLDNIKGEASNTDMVKLLKCKATQLLDEPYISDDFQIGPDGAYEHTEEDELKDWDVTLNDGLDNEPYISDDFQIGSEGAYEHANPDINYTKPGFVEKRTNQMLEHLANEAFKSVGDEGLFPNHTDKDIWTAGFKAGYLKK